MNNIIRQAAWHFEAIQLILKKSMTFVCSAAQIKRFSIVLASTVRRKTQACSSAEVLTSLFITFLQRSYVHTSLLISNSLQTSFSVSEDLQSF
jgi:hypothetical protein